MSDKNLGAYVSDIDDWNPEEDRKILDECADYVKPVGPPLTIVSVPLGGENWWERQFKNGGMPKRDGFAPWNSKDGN